MLLDHFFDLARVNVGSTADDHVFLAIQDEQVSTAVHVAHIAGVEPSIPQYVRRRLRLVPIAAHDGGTTHHHFAYLTSRDLVVFAIDNSERDTGPHDSR